MSCVFGDRAHGLDWDHLCERYVRMYGPEAFHCLSAKASPVRYRFVLNSEPIQRRIVKACPPTELRPRQTPSTLFRTIPPAAPRAAPPQKRQRMQTTQPAKSATGGKKRDEHQEQPALPATGGKKRDEPREQPALPAIGGKKRDEPQEQPVGAMRTPPTWAPPSCSERNPARPGRLLRSALHAAHTVQCAAHTWQ